MKVSQSFCSSSLLPVSPESRRRVPELYRHPEGDSEEGAQKQAQQESGLGECETQETEGGPGSAFCVPDLQNEAEALEKSKVLKSLSAGSVILITFSLYC